MVADERRVDVVERALGVAMVGCVRAHSWAVSIIEALDSFDLRERLDHPRGQMLFSDETEPDED